MTVGHTKERRVQAQRNIDADSTCRKAFPALSKPLLELDHAPPKRDGASRALFDYAAPQRWMLVSSPYALNKTLRNLLELPPSATPEPFMWCFT